MRVMTNIDVNMLARITIEIQGLVWHAERGYFSKIDIVCCVGRVDIRIEK